ncbi:5824_t:CDS:2 [Acaulospora morrowiae]|uniref:Casein kinase II subunit beta n=1 Tax=Acaulospora morrowiae TaxID=94023 RepID=A0A9N9A2D7_9GLOM|nr:5824_t:CDS:2 [Acaulospora morrowiae]
MWNSTTTSAAQANASASTNDPKEQQASTTITAKRLKISHLNSTEINNTWEFFQSLESDTSNDTGTESLTWISWFCTLPGHEYFAEVAEDFIEDDFNLTGLSSVVPFYKEALEMILDVESEEETLKVPDVSIVETSAELLYGLIHQRYIITRQDKYESGHFGCCPRVYCQSCSVIPCGRTDTPGLETVKLFCPNCLDLYGPPSSRFHNVDGAFFGTTFPHLLFQQYPGLLPNTPAKVYEPKIFGFRVNERSRSGPRMQWLRMRPGAVEGDVEGQDQSEGGGGNDDGEDDESLLGPGGGENNGSPGTTRKAEYNPPALDMELGLGSSKGGTKQNLNGEADKQEKSLNQKLSSAREAGRLREVNLGMSPLTKLIPTVVTTPTQSSISISTNELSPPLGSNAKVDFVKSKDKTLQTVFSGKECEERSRIKVNFEGGDTEPVGIEVASVKEMRRDFFDKWTGTNINSSVLDSTDTLTTRTEATINEVL